MRLGRGSSLAAGLALLALGGGVPARAAAVIALLALGGGVPARAAAASAVEAPPSPDLQGLEPAVAAQIAEARQALVAALADAAATPAALAAAWGLLGQLYHAYALPDTAASCYRQAARLAPGELRWPYLLGQAERARNDLAAAAAAFAEALGWDAYAPAEVALAEIALAQGDAAGAAVAAERALVLVPGDGAALAALGQARLSQRDFAGAAAALEAALRAVPGADRLHYPLALAYRGLGDGDRARRELALVGRAGPRPADPFLDEVDAARTGELVPLLRGRRAAAAGDWQGAVAEFRRALAANPASVRARVDLGAALGMAGDAAAARRELEAALAREPGNATAHFDLGVLRLGLGDAAGALPHLEAAVAARSGDPEAQRSLGEALLALGRPGDALLHLRGAIAAAPDDEAARFAEAVALVRLSRLDEARQRLEEAQRSMPEQGRLTHLLARLLAAGPDLAQRDGRRAVELAQRVWSAQPTADHARTVALALAEAGRCAEAAKLARALGLEVPAEERAALEAAAAEWEAGPPCRPGGAASPP